MCARARTKFDRPSVRSQAELGATRCSAAESGARWEMFVLVRDLEGDSGAKRQGLDACRLEGWWFGVVFRGFASNSRYVIMYLSVRIPVGKVWDVSGM